MAVAPPPHEAVERVEGGVHAHLLDHDTKCLGEHLDHDSDGACGVGEGEEGLVGGGGWRGYEELLLGPYRVSWVVRNGGDGQHRSPAHDLVGFVHLTMRRIPGGAKMMTPLQECLVGSKVFTEGCARLLCMHTPRSEAKLHGRYQGAQAIRELAELCEEVGQDGQMSERCCPRDEVFDRQERRHWVSPCCLWRKWTLET